MEADVGDREGVTAERRACLDVERGRQDRHLRRTRGCLILRQSGALTELGRRDAGEGGRRLCGI